MGKGDLTALKAIVAAKCDLEVVNVSEFIQFDCALCPHQHPSPPTPSPPPPGSGPVAFAQDKSYRLNTSAWVKERGEGALCVQSVMYCFGAVLGRDSFWA